jgi:hypothetical protein
MLHCGRPTLLQGALGHKQTCAPQKVMSALLPIATAKADSRKSRCPLYPQERTCAVQLAMSALGQKRTSGREVRHASFDDVGLVSSHGASELTETGRRTQMTKLVDVRIFDWDKYSPDDLVQKDDNFQLGPALLPALVKSGRATTCGARARLRRPRSGSSRPGPA